MRGSLDAELAPYLDVRREGRTLSSFVDELTDGELEALRHAALVMLRPDATLSGKANRVLDWLEQEHRIVVADLVIERLDLRRFDNQYVTELPLISAGLRLHHRVARAGPTAFALVAGPPGDDASMAFTLDRLKGASSPGMEKDNSSLRARFGRQSSFHVVLHTSEDAGDFLQGSIDVFGWARIRRFLRDCGNGRPPVFSRPARELLVGELSAPVDRNVYEVLLSVKRRILVQVELCWQADTPLPPQLTDLKGIYESCELGQGTFADQRAAFLRLARAERAPLEAIVRLLEAADVAGRGGAADASALERWREMERRAAPLRLAYASWLLSGHEEYYADDGAFLIAALESKSIVLSEMEQTLVASALGCDANPNTVFSGHRTYPLETGGLS